MAYSNTTGLPSPSTILRPWIDDTYFTDESRERGTAVHAACTDHVMGKFSFIEKIYRGYFDSFRRWVDEETPSAICINSGLCLVEHRIVSKSYGYCGKPDLPCRIESRPGYGVADLKTSKTIGKAWPLQISGYRKLVEEEICCQTSWGCSIRLKEDGSYPLVKFYDQHEIYFNLFLSALNLWRHFNK